MNIKFNKKELNHEYNSGPFFITQKLLTDFKKLNILSKTCAYNANDGEISAEICNLFIPSLNKPEISLEFGDIDFFAGQTTEFLSKVYLGDILTAKTKLSKVYSKTGRSGHMVFVEWETIFKNQTNNYVSKVTDSFVRIEI